MSPFPSSEEHVSVDSPSFVVFSDDWGIHQSSSQHLFRRIVRRHQVVWVNTIGMRGPKLTLGDIQKAWRKISRMIGIGGREASSVLATDGPSVCQPLMLPFSSLRIVRWINKILVGRALKERLRQLSIARPIVVSTVPNACDFVRDLNPSRIVYYCVDDFSLWPGLDYGLVAEMEAKLEREADILIATSRKLYERLAESGKATYLLSHGVDVDHFSKAAAVHPVLQSIGSPRAVYFGLFDERSDQELIAILASRIPEYSFVIAGPMAVEPARLRGFPNVHFLGPIPYGELPALIAGSDALIIPYVVNALTDAISPLKLKEYMITGKMVIATPLAETRGLESLIVVAKNVEEWVAALESARSTNFQRRQVEIRTELAGETWEIKAAEFLRICNAAD